ncbi:type I-C CRISPR-associated protein Cas8c/Csd1 [Pseudorhodoferax sp.]|uniref:type I-C CRISPR-associated protein Cas8c/Csd1 n=1 Tax=Pseudorhodoferax sp. TaxID=1993553 RepID=UPI0039E5F5FE
MILQALTDYYDRRCADPDPAQRLPAFGLEEKEIPFVIELAPDGTVLQLKDTRMPVGKKLRAKVHLVPLGEKKTSGIKANLLWDTAAYVIGLARERKGKAELTPAQAYRQRIETLPEAARSDAGVRAVLAALERNDWSVLEAHPAWPEIRETNPVMTFQLARDADLVCQRPAVVAAAMPAAAPDDAVGLCLVDGVEQPIQRVHASIKGVRDAQTSGANVVSFNERAFESYGKAKRQGENAPIGQRAAFAYTTALNSLLGKDSKNRLQVGDASTVFWADRATAFPTLLSDLFGEDKDEPDRGRNTVAALLNALQSGQLPHSEHDVQFFVLGLAPNAARISVRFWIKAPFGELAPRILQHFDDLRVVRRFDNDPPTPSLFRLLSGLALQGKLDNVPPRLGGEWMRAILEGLPYPAGLLNAAVIRCKAERDVTYLRAAVLKAWLNREQRRADPTLPIHHAHFKENLDMEQDNVPYRLGRLFAVLERIQQQAQPGINATIRDRYYGAASTTPVVVFTTLLRLKNAHLKKLSDGQVAYFERLIGDTVQAMTEFPRQLTLADQGRFALGYYHQRQAFYSRKDEAPTADVPHPSATSIATTEEA